MIHQIQMSDLEKRILSYCNQNNIFGVLRITLKDQIVYNQSIGLANIEKGTPFTEHSMFTYYSLSKPFCVIGLMKLKDKGLIDIDAHPSRYVPEMKGFDKRVTIRQMLHHISGLPDFEQCIYNYPRMILILFSYPTADTEKQESSSPKLSIPHSMEITKSPKKAAQKWIMDTFDTHLFIKNNTKRKTRAELVRVFLI